MINKELRENITRIKEIGRDGFAIEEDVKRFSGNLRGSEFLFRISWANAKNYIDDEVEDFVKGLHYTELKFREINNNDFVFGSPSPTYKVIQALEKRDKEKATQLKDWVSENGGNYYIPEK